MRDRQFSQPMSLLEKIVGWAYVPVHIFLMPIFLPNLVGLCAGFGIRISSIQLNLIYYLAGFFVLCVFLNRFLRATFSDLCDSVLNSIRCVFVGLLYYYAMVYCVNFVLGFFITDLINPNTDAVITEAQVNSKSMFVVSVLLAPIVEEILFRGVIFGTIRTKSRIAAYVVSALIFSVYHLWQYFAVGYDIGVLVLYMFQYLPGSIMLAKTYEDSGNLWAPILMHMIINYLALLVSKFV